MDFWKAFANPSVSKAPTIQAEPDAEGHMPPPSGDAPQTPDSKGTGLARVFKSLTGGGSQTKGSTNYSIPPLHLVPAGSPNTGTSPQGGIHGGPADNEKLFEQLKAGKTLAERKSAADGLRLALEGYPVSGVASIWYAGKDLIDHKNPVEVRHSGFQLLTACVQHGSSTDRERKEYFDTLTSRLEPEDFYLQLASVVELADQGKNLSGFHYEVIPLLTRWLRSAWDILEDAREEARNQARSKGRSQSKAPLGEDTNLHNLFAFIVDVIRFTSIVSPEEETAQLIDGVLYIALHARSPEEILSCVRILDAIVIYSSIPGAKLRECVTVLCSIYCIVAEAKDVTWRTIRNLCKSHNGHTTVAMLLNILRNPPSENLTPGNVREIRGALSVLEKIMSKDGRNGWPVVPFALLMESLSTVLTIEHEKVESEVLRLILSLFNDEPDSSKENIMEEDWGTMFEIAAKCSLRASETSDGRRIENPRSGMSPAPSSTSGSVDTGGNAATSMAQMLYMLILRIEVLVLSSPADFLQRENCISFFSRVNAHLPESCAKLVIEHYTEFRLCYPSDPDWKFNIQTLLEAFFSNRSRPAQVRLLALKAITDVYEIIEMMDEREDPDGIFNFVSSILVDLTEERDVVVLHEVISFAVSVADTAEATLFDYIMKQMHHSISTDQLHSPLSPTSSRLGTAGSQSSAAADARSPLVTPAFVVTRGIVQLFMRAMQTSSSKALRAFDEILWIAKSNVIDTDARLSAMKMLFRLRADWANRIFLTPFTEADALAASLYRTPASLASKQAADEAQLNRVSRITEDSSNSRASRSSSSTQLQFSGTLPRTMSGISRAVSRAQPMWMTPDPDALPEVASEKASILLVSILDKAEDECPSMERKLLKINVWLETLLGLLQQGCDWEVYSYILVHLPSQLSNQALFKGAIPQIKLLRGVICQQIKNGSFHEPPSSSGLRKADVSICLFQALNMVTSYHQHFSRNEEDEIVKTFIQGVNAWDKAAKSCIHALSICCHELPNSMKLVLGNILQKMSQIITQAHVAVHILEFLATLARIPELYAHFREEEYRIVFGVCFRYLQYAREKAQDAKLAANRHSNTPSRNVSTPVDMSKSMAESPTSETASISDELPQYVYALAYHVITFWFLSLPLPDRAGQVTWITRNLVWTDLSGKQNVDEQSQVTMNFLQRTAYADVDESAADPNFTEKLFGEILKKRWLVGNSIVTIEQATRGGWAQITKRQPSGTSHYMIREKFERPPAHQIKNLPEGKREVSDSDPNVVLPSHLLVQLAAPSPLTVDIMRPIPLPDDDMIKRAIASFDRNPTVDCHKVGIIYIGENQTQEVEIMANVMGSSDYTDFLSSIGALTKLHGATFNTQGLDRQYNTDGEYTFCWRDRVTEMVFHVTTLMPTNLEHDPQCSNKKKHIGNDFVNIIFNNSGLPFRFDTFPSQFNYVYIVITPESKASFVATRLRGDAYTENAFYKVQVMSKEGFPEISPAAETKIVSLKALPEFIRLLALNASVFSLVWYNRAGGEHVSSWRNRLREIVRLREKYGSKQAQNNSTTSPPNTAQSSGAMASDASNRSVRDSVASLRRSSVATFLTNASDERASKHFANADTEVGTMSAEDTSMVDSLDFSKWA